MKFNIANAKRKIICVGLLALGFGLGGCKSKPVQETDVTAPKQDQASQDQAKQDQHIKVQHILIGFSGTLPGKKIERTQEQAQKLANEILEKAKAGQDYDALVKKHTDDRAPGIYGMSNTGVAPEGEEFPRDQMVGAFGDVGFTLKVGEIGLAPYDKARSPFGYHIIKRLK